MNLGYSSWKNAQMYWQKKVASFFLCTRLCILKLTLSLTMSNQRSVSGTLSASRTFASDVKAEKNQAMYVSFKGNTATHIFLHVPFEASKILGGRGSPRNGGSACGPSKTIVPTDRRQLCILGGKQKKLNGVCMECQASVTLQDWMLRFGFNAKISIVVCLFTLCWGRGEAMQNLS